MAVKPGIYAASVSIFKEDMSLDILNTISHAEKLILKGGCHGTVLLSSTGMAQYISLKEKKKLIDKAGSSECKDNFVLGTGSNSLLENCEIIKHSLSNGINRFLLMPPAYFSYPDSGVYKYFANIIERVPEIFIILYNFEKLCGYKFSVQVIEKLVKDFPAQIVAVKDSSYNLINTLDLDILIFPGSELKLLEGLESSKCHGIISAVANISSKISRQIYEDHHNKKKQTLNNRNCAIRKIMDKHSLISGVHSFLTLEDKKYKVVLPPLSLLSKEQEKKMMEEFKALDFFPEKTKNIAA